MVLVTKTKRKAPTHHRRRHGQHHKQDRHYTNTYWPYLPLVAIVGLGIVLNTFWATVQSAVLGYATNMSSSSLLQETNEERSGSGLATLSISDRLTQAAQAKANDMAARNYWSHNTPEGTPPWTFMTQAGYAYYTAGENLAYGFEDSGGAVAGWMASPGHRDNILNTTFKEVGFGIANVPDYQDNGEQTIVVAMYGSVAGVAAAAPSTASPTPKSAAPQPAPAPAPSPTPAAAEPTGEPTPIASATPTSEGDTVTPTTSLLNSPKEEQKVARFQLIAHTTSAEWSMLALSALTAIAVVIFFVKHGLLWHRVLVRGEKFIMKHHLLDVALVAIAVLGFVLTRSVGSIH